MARRTRKSRPERAAAKRLPPAVDTVPCASCGSAMPRARRDEAGLATCPACTEPMRFVEVVDSSKATGFEIRVAPPDPPTELPPVQGGAVRSRPAAEERPLRRNSSLEDALGLHARKGPSASKVWGRRDASPVEEDESELAREMRSNRRETW